MEKTTRRKDPSVKITLSQLKSVSKNKVKAKRLFFKLAGLKQINRPEPKQLSNKYRGAKLSSTLNPNSKFYDNTPNLTKKLSLLWFTYQQGLGRLSAKRITSSDRQWAILSRIKTEIVRVSSQLGISFPVLAKLVFKTGEDIAIHKGKKSIYLTTIISRLDEIFDKVESALNTEVTSLEEEIFESYSTRRSEVTGRTWKKEIVPGSDDHHILKLMAKIITEYGLRVDKFLDIQFEAFKVFDSFPRLKNMITDAAIDRLDQALPQKEKHESREDQEYWDGIEKSSRKNKR